MWKKRDGMGALFCPCAWAVFGALAIGLGSGRVLALEAYEDANTPEGWSLPQIMRNEMPDFNERCDTPALDPMDENDARWFDDCRKLSAQFLQDLLTRPPWREAIPVAGIQIKGARIVGKLDLDSAKLIRTLSILASRIEDDINLSHVRTDGLIWLEGSLISGVFNAEGLHSESDLYLREGTLFKGEVKLNNAIIDGSVELTGARFERKLNARQVTIGDYLLMGSSEQHKASFHDVVLEDAKVGSQLYLFGATFDGLLDARRLKVGGSLWAPSVGSYRTRFNNVALSGAEITGDVSLIGTSFDGSLLADLLQVGGSLLMVSDNQNRATFKFVDLSGAKVARNLGMDGANFDGELWASLLQVGDILSMASRPSNTTNFKMNVFLNGAKVTENLVMDGARFDGTLDASRLQVGGNLSMAPRPPNTTNFRENVFLSGAKVVGNLVMDGASFDGTLDADLLQVGGNLSMVVRPPYFTSFKTDVSLNSAKIEGKFNVIGTRFAGKLNAESLKLTGNLSMRDVCSADKALMAYANFGGHVDLRGASLADTDLSGSTVAGELRLDGKGVQGCTRSNAAPDILNLRNAKVANLLVADDGLTPMRRLRLDGFSFSHMGGFEGDVKSRLRERPAEWWDKWVRRDPDYSPTAYTQLATVFNSAGDSEAAEDIRYLGREREREVLCQESWLRGSCILQTVLGAVAGYGIGSHTFVVLYWVLGFWLAGVLLLWWTVPAARHNGIVWCCFASLAQLLPVITINKELTAFFDDPQRRRLKGWQVVVFSALGLVGLALGTLLLIAVSGLTRTA